jgi:ABC-2 type transport system ATP-binding protein
MVWLWCYTAPSNHPDLPHSSTAKRYHQCKNLPKAQLKLPISNRLLHTMRITLDKVSKRYGTEYILKDVTCTLEAGKKHVLLGPNGSGKSTLMKIISGHLSPTRGRIKYQLDTDTEVMPDQIYRQVAYAAPYIDLIEEFTMREVLALHARTRGWQAGMTTEDVIQVSDLVSVTEKQIRYFSSGMKQRLKIAMTLGTQASIVLLDEPTTNLDQRAVQWYQDTTRRLAGDRLVIIASNDPTDAAFGDVLMEVSAYK